MFLWISSKSCPLNLFLARSHLAEIIVLKRLSQGHYNVTEGLIGSTTFRRGRLGAGRLGAAD